MPRGSRFYANSSKLRIAKHYNRESRADESGEAKGREKGRRGAGKDERGTSAKGHRLGESSNEARVRTRHTRRVRFPWRDEKRIRA